MCLQYFDTVGWVLWPVKTVDRITYTVLVVTLNPAQSKKPWNQRPPSAKPLEMPTNAGCAVWQVTTTRLWSDRWTVEWCLTVISLSRLVRRSFSRWSPFYCTHSRSASSLTKESMFWTLPAYHRAICLRTRWTGVDKWVPASGHRPRFDLNHVHSVLEKFLNLSLNLVVVDFVGHHSIAQPWKPPTRSKDLWDTCYTSWVIAHYVKYSHTVSCHIISYCTCNFYSSRAMLLT